MNTDKHGFYGELGELTRSIIAGKSQGLVTSSPTENKKTWLELLSAASVPI